MLLSLKSCRVGFTVLLTLWIAGGGCMLGCQNMGTMTAEAVEQAPVTHHSALIVSGDACAAGEGHDCCAKKKVATQNAYPSARSRTKNSLKTATLISQTTFLIPAPGD
jgi:hypothetical protein